MAPDVTLQDFLDRIKREGVDEAKKEAEKLLAEAKASADAIIAAARNEADALRAGASADIERDKEAAHRALTQAGRDLLLSVRQEIIALGDRVLEREVRTALTPELIADTIRTIAANWHSDSRPQLEVFLSDEHLTRVKESLLGSLQEEMKEGVVFTPIKGIQAGFRIGEKDSGLVYDFTDEGIAEVLAAYLNPRVAQVLMEPAGNDPVQE
jgi:V/A-type H+-transporting ATPase subunit E